MATKTLEITPTHMINGGKVLAAKERPYFAPAIYAMVLIESRQVATLAVDKYLRCYWNPDLIKQYPVPFIAGMLTHEVSHFIRNHHARALAIPGVDHDRWNCAGDYEINDDLCSETRSEHSTEILTPLPDWVLTPKKDGYDEGLLAETYYRLIKDPPECKRGSKGEKGKGQGKGSSSDGAGKGPGAGDCGSCAGGAAQPYELPPPDDSGKSDDGLTEAEAELVRQQVASEVNRIAATAEGRGTLPAGLRRWAEGFMKPQVNYSKWVRAVLKNAFAEARGAGDFTFRRPARRQHAFGRFIMPGTLRPQVRVGFIVDTSGSMSDTQLGQCMAEIRGFASNCRQNAQMYALSCDAAVHKIQKIENAKQLELFGGGGTDMRIAFEAFERMKPAIDLIICLTDCETPWPAQKPKQTTVIIQVGRGALPDWPCHHVRIQPEAK
jgi:predicted metal-dependent peptidase